MRLHIVNDSHVRQKHPFSFVLANIIAIVRHFFVLVPIICHKYL